MVNHSNNCKRCNYHSNYHNATMIHDNKCKHCNYHAVLLIINRSNTCNNHSNTYRNIYINAVIVTMIVSITATTSNASIVTFRVL